MKTLFSEKKTLKQNFHLVHLKEGGKVIKLSWKQSFFFLWMEKNFWRSFLEIKNLKKFIQFFFVFVQKWNVVKWCWICWQIFFRSKTPKKNWIVQIFNRVYSRLAPRKNTRRNIGKYLRFFPFIRFNLSKISSLNILRYWCSNSLLQKSEIIALLTFY